MNYKPNIYGQKEKKSRKKAIFLKNPSINFTWPAFCWLFQLFL